MEDVISVRLTLNDVDCGRMIRKYRLESLKDYFRENKKGLKKIETNGSRKTCLKDRD